MRKSAALVLILTIVLSLFAAVPAAMADCYYVCPQNGGTLNLHEEPNTNSKVLLKIPMTPA